MLLFRKANSILEVDDEGGRMFLRVLTHLIMHDYPPLVSGALQLLFKHFSQRQEVLHTFKQVRPAYSAVVFQVVARSITRFHQSG